MSRYTSNISFQCRQRIYKKGWNAVHIHDCIVVPKDGSKNHPTQQQIVEIMEDVFKDYGLCPSFSCSRY